VIVVVTALAVAPGSANTRGGNVSSGRITASAQRSAARYWTKARMAAAKPINMTITASQAAALGASSAPAIGRPEAIAPSSPKGAGPAAALSADPTTCCPGAAYTYPAPFTRYGLFPGSQYNVYPYRTHGKLFFTQGAGNFVCSGTVVSSVGLWLVETAGHCVASSTTHTFSTNVVFVPAYRSGIAPFGSWTAFTQWTKSAWIQSGNFREDRGFVLLNANGLGQKIQSVVGSEGIAFNQSYLQGFTDFGYPAAAPFTGATQQICTSSTEETDPFIGGTGSVPLGIGCDQTGGSSGGGWVIRFGSGGGYVNGHNDYKYSTPSRPLEMFSPYFDSSEQSLYNCATDNVC
jgi:hypothetical protein